MRDRNIYTAFFTPFVHSLWEKLFSKTLASTTKCPLFSTVFKSSLPPIWVLVYLSCLTSYHQLQNNYTPAMLLSKHTPWFLISILHHFTYYAYLFSINQTNHTYLPRLKSSPSQNHTSPHCS